MVSKNKESVIRVRMGSKNPSLVITVCHHSTSLVMPNGYPRGGVFDPTLTLMIFHVLYVHLYIHPHFLYQNDFQDSSYNHAFKNGKKTC